MTASDLYKIANILNQSEKKRLIQMLGNDLSEPKKLIRVSKSKLKLIEYDREIKKIFKSKTTTR